MVVELTRTKVRLSSASYRKTTRRCVNRTSPKRARIWIGLRRSSCAKGGSGLSNSFRVWFALGERDESRESRRLIGSGTPSRRASAPKSPRLIDRQIPQLQEPIGATVRSWSRAPRAEGGADAGKFTGHAEGQNLVADGDGFAAHSRGTPRLIGGTTNTHRVLRRVLDHSGLELIRYSYVGNRKRPRTHESSRALNCTSPYRATARCEPADGGE